MKPRSILLGLLAVSILSACGNNESATATDKGVETDSTTGNNTSAQIKEEAVEYTAPDGTKLKGYVAYDEAKTGPRPVVLVVPEWWGLTEYPRMRAKMLAEMGYLAMAVDMYGDGKLAANPGEAQAAATPFYNDPQLGKGRLDAALAKVRSMPQADTGKTAAIGYCFGGSMVLNYAKLGAPIDGVVSFHGNLAGPAPTKNMTSAVLVCHGGADGFVPEAEVSAFRKSMDSVGKPYTFKVYEGATHAFTNPNATEKGKEFNLPLQYNGAADTASWNDMKTFFGTVLR